MKIGILGAGAMGSIYGAGFQDAGHDVRFIDANEPLVDALNRDGLTIERHDGTVQHYAIPATSHPTAADDPVDLVSVHVKGFATGAAAELVRPVVAPTTLILTLQNGLGNEDVLRDAFPSNPILIGNSLHSVSVVGPAHVRHTGVHDTHLGPSDDRWSDAARRAGGALERSGFRYQVHLEQSIRQQIWSKFVMNCGSLAIAALTQLATDEMHASELVMSSVDEMVRETCVIGRAAGFDLDADERVAFTRGLFRTAGGKASMHQDIEAGRRTEIDTLNGAALRIARDHGVPAPLNGQVFALVKGREIAMGVRS